MKAKMSYCAKCEKAVRVIIEDLISANELKQFNKEVEQMKLQVKYIPVEEYNLQLFCTEKVLRAKWGQAKGLQGRTYGIPTKDASIRRTLTIEEIKPFVDEFIEFAKANVNLIFLVTEIGCGLAGLKPKEVAPLFKDAVNVFNIYLPSRF